MQFDKIVLVLLLAFQFTDHVLFVFFLNNPLNSFYVLRWKLLGVGPVESKITL